MTMKNRLGSKGTYLVLIIFIGAILLTTLLFSAQETFLDISTFSYMHQFESNNIRCDDAIKSCHVSADRSFKLTQPLISGKFKFEPPSSLITTNWITKNGNVQVEFNDNLINLKPGVISELTQNIRVKVIPQITYTTDDNGVQYIRDVKLRFDFYVNTADKLYVKKISANQEVFQSISELKFNVYNDVYSGLAIRNVVREKSNLFNIGEKTTITEEKIVDPVITFSTPISTNQLGDMTYYIQPSIIFKTGETEYIIPGKLTTEITKIVPRVEGTEDIVVEKDVLITDTKSAEDVSVITPKLMITIISGIILLIISILFFKQKRR